MTECTHLFWHEFYQVAGIGAGLFLGAMGPLLLVVFAFALALFRQQHRHEERMQAARLEEQQQGESRYRVLRGGQG